MAPPPLPAQISGPLLHMLVLALFGVHTCSQHATRRSHSLVLSCYHALHACWPFGLYTMSLRLFIDELISSTRFYGFSYHLFGSLALHITLEECMAWVFRESFIGINIPYGSRHDRALLVYFLLNQALQPLKTNVSSVPNL